jgi:hypothetical protein
MARLSCGHECQATRACGTLFDMRAFGLALQLGLVALAAHATAARAQSPLPAAQSTVSTPATHETPTSGPLPLAPPATSSATSASASPVVLVMESGGGVHAAVELRAFLNRQPNLRVLSLADAARQQVQPAAVLTVATDPNRAAVRVVYWDLSGGTDALAAPAPAKPEDIGAVVLALTSALLERHRPELSETTSATALASRASGLDSLGNSRAFYAMLGRFNRLIPRTNVELRFEDF